METRATDSDKLRLLANWFEREDVAGRSTISAEVQDDLRRIADYLEACQDKPKVERDGEIAVLYSPGYGAGWYSWNTRFPDCLFSPEIVQFLEALKALNLPPREKEQARIDGIAPIAKKLFGEEFYSGGAKNLRIQWVPKGCYFSVVEREGSEQIETMEISDEWILA